MINYFISGRINIKGSVMFVMIIQYSYSSSWMFHC